MWLKVLRVYVRQTSYDAADASEVHHARAHIDFMPLSTAAWTKGEVWRGSGIPEGWYSSRSPCNCRGT